MSKIFERWRTDDVRCQVFAKGERNKGNAFVEYEIVTEQFTEDAKGKSDLEIADIEVASSLRQTIKFQNGHFKDVGINGHLMDAFLAICADRLQGFAAGPFSCQENFDMFDLIKRAIDKSDERFTKRQKRGVANKYEK